MKNPNDLEEQVREIVSQLEEDLEARHGFRQVWQGMDLYDKAEMIALWRAIVRRVLDRGLRSE